MTARARRHVRHEGHPVLVMVIPAALIVALLLAVAVSRG